MQPTTPVKQGFLKSRFYNASTIILAVIVTSAVCITIAGQWRSYDWVSKFLGIVLMLHLLIGPLTVIRRLKKGNSAGPDIFILIAYTWLLLATMLFTR